MARGSESGIHMPDGQYSGGVSGDDSGDGGEASSQGGPLPAQRATAGDLLRRLVVDGFLDRGAVLHGDGEGDAIRLVACFPDAIEASPWLDELRDWAVGAVGSSGPMVRPVRESSAEPAAGDAAVGLHAVALDLSLPGLPAYVVVGLVESASQQDLARRGQSACAGGVAAASAGGAGD